MSKKKTHEQYVDELKNISKDIEVIGVYDGALKKIAHKCLIHNYIWEVVPASVLHGYGCPLCGIEKSHKHLRKTHEEYLKELSQINDKIIPMEEYKGALTKILHKCTIDNFEWYVTPAKLLSSKGCPKCNNKYRRTHEDYLEELKIKNPKLIPLDKYIGANTPIKHLCLIHNYEWDISPTGALNGNGCPVCHSESLHKAKSITHEQYIENLHKVHPNINPMEIYKGALEKIKHKCNIDGYEWYVTPACVLRYNCPKCANKLKVTQNEFIERLKQVNPYIEVVGELKNMRSNIRVKCKIDNYEWDIRAEALLSGRRCPVCSSKSLGELNIKKYLDDKNIQYEYQKRFSDCKDNRSLAFDFYIPNKNMCIEFDGIQHFEPIDFAGKGLEWAKQMFISTQKRDDIKNKYCSEKGIDLIRIPYFKDITEELNLLFT